MQNYLLTNMRPCMKHKFIHVSFWAQTSKYPKEPFINYVVSREEGGGGSKNCQFYLVKRRLRGG